MKMKMKLTQPLLHVVVDVGSDSVPTNFIRILFVDDSNTVSPKGFVFGERGNLLRWQG